MSKIEENLELLINLRNNHLSDLLNLRLSNSRVYGNSWEFHELDS